jgi:hypothetical protein
VFSRSTSKYLGVIWSIPEYLSVSCRSTSLGQRQRPTCTIADPSWFLFGTPYMEDTTSCLAHSLVLIILHGCSVNNIRLPRPVQANILLHQTKHLHPHLEHPAAAVNLGMHAWLAD